jgi:hypothetical protein
MTTERFKSWHSQKASRHSRRDDLREIEMDSVLLPFCFDTLAPCWLEASPDRTVSLKEASSGVACLGQFLFPEVFVARAVVPDPGFDQVQDSPADILNVRRILSVEVEHDAHPGRHYTEVPGDVGDR